MFGKNERFHLGFDSTNNYVSGGNFNFKKIGQFDCILFI
jgi:hypothetical protein